MCMGAKHVLIHNNINVLYLSFALYLLASQLHLTH
jgi:hypothetical protein